MCTILAAVPGRAFGGCVDEECRTEQRAAVHHGEHDDCSGCSPFIACAGCNGFVAEERIVTRAPVPMTEPAIFEEMFCEGNELDYWFGFWQPLRLTHQS